MRRIVHGTPITPRRLLQGLKGGSFCVSFAAPEQAAECAELVGADGILILDNGAFSHWKQGKGAIDREAFWSWANDVQAYCPQAVAVVPDVIEGDEAANLTELSLAIRHGYAEFPERCMGIWHMNDSHDYLVRQLRLLNFVGIGSCAQYDVQRQRAAYLGMLRRVYDTRAAVLDEHGRCPWVHLMRGLGVFSEAAWAESADSTNIARNHCRHRARGDARAAYMHDKIAKPIQRAARALPVSDSTGSNFGEATPKQRELVA